MQFFHMNPNAFIKQISFRLVIKLPYNSYKQISSEYNVEEVEKKI